ncbi:hypothetical protein P170DRAFT_513714 [Aspergillus steynii IBT 23096]|uniref:Uncharacterized protein n=1 Tax=Aspergillus steynii IBT 23096 TaxID=1392250 RepID=A0A2I2FV78_9EURO|nr:uncharacterized protein P170DRAFT_513714 [Aspergillus steynii IBT 23096]PLB44549.1 hypothetical protein P170DRAFT_513714 [Aspergillus steynii IBT 23096]
MRFTSIFGKTEPEHPEWIPPMLRWFALISLAVSASGIIAALEILRHFTVVRVLSPNNEGILFATRYLPTLAIIALGYLVKGVASDLKKVTPWANMSGKWATSSRSVLLDYVNAMEIVAVFSALRRKDWAVFVGLVCAFICGALVPLANAVAYVDLFAPRNITATSNQTSAFQFDNSPLVMANDSLTIPWNSTGMEPYARAISQRLGSAPRTLWTTENYVFDQFSVPSIANATATAEVNAISALLDCQQLRYSPTNRSSTFAANPDDLKAAGCNMPLEIATRASGDQSSAWLNITQCSDHEDRDTQILAIYVSNSPQLNGSASAGNLSMAGLICSPKFTSQRASLSVNSTTSEITAFSMLSEPQPLDIKTSTEALWLYLRNPLDSETQKIFGKAQLDGVRGTYNPGTRPVANMPNITSAIVWTEGPRDPFMQVALDGYPEKAPIEHDVFEGKVTQFAGIVWAELLSFLARSEASNEIPVSIALTDERVLLRTPVVRTVQALLGVLGVLAIVFALQLRPKTVLGEDPGSLAAGSVILSASSAAVEKEMARHALSSTQSMTTSLSSTRFMLRQRNAGQRPAVTIDMTKAPVGQEPVEMVDLNGQNLGEAAYERAPEDPDQDSSLGKGAELDGWRPLPLRIASKVALGVAVVVVMIGLGIMLWLSGTHDGICVDTQVSSAALTLSTSTVLVLFGYSFAGVDAAAQAQAPFNILRRRPNDQAIFTDDLTLLGRLSGLGSTWMNTTLYASAAAYILIIPAMKLVAAGLFSPLNTGVVDLISVQIDTSITTHLGNMLKNSSDTPITIAPVVKRACDFAEWETNPVFGLRPRPGIVGNLVLDNLTAVVDVKNNIPGSVIEARVPAIAVDIQCEPIPSSDFNMSLRRAGRPGDGESMTFTWTCTTERCSGRHFSADPLGTEIPSYSGQVSLDWPSEWARHGSESQGLPASGTDYSVFIADLTSLGGSIHSFRNMTPIPIAGDGILATPNTLNVTLPPVVATTCRRNLTIVNVNATFTRPTPVALETGAPLSPWRPVSVDLESIQYARPYPDVQPEYFQPPKVEMDMFGQTYDDSLVDGILWSNSLWPARGSSRNFFELLAADAQHRVGNLSRLLTPDGLTDSAKHMYTAYCTQILSELRTVASNTSLSPSANQTIPARLFHSQLRVHQDPRTTYILLALLGTVACFALLVFCHFPDDAILPKEPGSIASRLSLLADSILVRQLRQEQVSDVNELRKWREPAALGWWRDGPIAASDTPNNSSTPAWRWGVDIGRDVTLQSWKDPPLSPSPSPPPPAISSTSPSRSSVRSEPILPGLPFQPGEDEGPSTSTHSPRSSVSRIDGGRRGHPSAFAVWMGHDSRSTLLNSEQELGDRR